MDQRWIIKSTPDNRKVEQLSKEINVNPVLSSILIQRGIDTYKKAKSYFRPSLSGLHDPFLMEDMDLAIERLNRAIHNGENILIYGDYDVDGTTSVALVFSYLKKIYSNVLYYIPDRYQEGYGISKNGIEWANKNNINLIISLDCGIKAIEMTKLANKKGIDLIICDHHLPGATLPEAYAILDPKRKECKYPYKDLSGCGVGFKFMQGFAKYNKLDDAELFEYLDFLAVSIASDIVPVNGENRIFSYFGLEKLNSNPRPGLKALIDVAGLRGKVTISGIVFGIGPRINAAGRMTHAGLAVELLISDSYKKAEHTALEINSNNNERRSFDSNITQEALKMIENDTKLKNAKSTVLFKSDWHKGVIGIVASRCIDKYYRPTIILTKSKNKATGSARSVDGFDVYEAIAQCSDLLDQYGGHMYAAGLTMDIDKIASFQKRFEKIVEEKITDEQLIPHLDIDQIISVEIVTPKFLEILKQMAPFGPANLQPLFISENLFVTNRPRILKEDHLKFYVHQEGSDTVIETIGFGLAQYFELINSGMRFKMAYAIEENNYLNQNSIQFIAKDIKFD
ncbi:MAG: single-stranded-DNA-specific exonuclease RecJ [Cyclobacteriaceae bacterium]|jgi:single-stranded-DNA-specific exonuclease